MARRILAALLIGGMMAGCQPQIAAPAATSPTDTPVRPTSPVRRTPHPSTPIAPAPGTVPTALPSQSMPALFTTAVLPANLSAWKLLVPAPNVQPALLEPAGAGYQLRPDWIIDTIRYDFERGDAPGTSRISTTIVRTDSGYTQDGGTLPVEYVRAFVDALTNLYPVQSELRANGIDGGFPRRRVTLVGADGQTVHILSSNTANGFGAPWTVQIGREQFAQYDGALAVPLAQLLGNEVTIPGATSTVTAGIAFNSAGAPAGGYQFDTQADDVTVNYRAEPPTITGRVEMRSFVGVAAAIMLHTADGGSVSCAFSETPAPYGPSFNAYEFSCAAPEAVDGQNYAYDLVVDIPDQVPVSLKLTGTWGAPFDALLLAPPAQWRAASASAPAVQDLLRDHQLLYLTYGASLNPADPLMAELGGEALLIGQTAFDNRPLRYSIETPFAIKNGVLTRWDLDRTSLDALLRDILVLPLTRRVLTMDPQAVINLRYSAKPVAETPYKFSEEFFFPTAQLDIAACGAIPGGVFPSDTQPLRGFSYNQPFAMWPRSTEFVLIDGTPVAVEVELYGSEWDQYYPAMKGAVYAALVPEGLEDEPLLAIWQRADRRQSDPLTLTIRGGSAARIKSLNMAFAGGDRGGYNEWETQGATLRVDDDGVLRLVSCE